MKEDVSTMEDIAEEHDAATLLSQSCSKSVPLTCKVHRCMENMHKHTHAGK